MKLINLLAAALLLPLWGHASSQNEETHVEIGTMAVERYGDNGTPLILIPGLGCGGWVWDETVARLKKDHVLYVVTLAGFDGRPPAEGGKPFEQAERSLLDLIVKRHIDKPVLVGHSLGGTLAISFAQKHSDLIAGLVAVDGLAVLPGTENLSADQRKAGGEALAQQMRALTPDLFRQQQEQYVKTIGSVDAQRASRLAERTSRSDAGAVADYLADDMALDLRPGLAKIGVPVLVVSPYYAPDLAPMQISESGKSDYYKRLMEGVPHLEVVSIANARHFVMQDQPDAFNETLVRFIDGLGRADKTN